MVVHAARTSLWLADEMDDRDAVEALLGRSRAAALPALTRPRTTGQLATESSLSPASAPQHAATLRAARLITTEREGPRVRHRITPLGLDLLGAPPHRP